MSWALSGKAWPCSALLGSTSPTPCLLRVVCSRLRRATAGRCRGPWGCRHQPPVSRELVLIPALGTKGTEQMLVPPSLVEVTDWSAGARRSQGASGRSGDCPPPREPAAGSWWHDAAGKSCRPVAPAEDRTSMARHSPLVSRRVCVPRGGTWAPPSSPAQCLEKPGLGLWMRVSAGQVRASSGVREQGSGRNSPGRSGEAGVQGQLRHSQP